MPVIDIRKIGGSLVTSVAREDIAPGDFSVLRNFVFDESGFPVVRGGKASFGMIPGIGSQVNSMAVYSHKSPGAGGEDYIAVHGFTNIYVFSMDGSRTSILSSYAEPDTPAVFATMNGYLIWTSAGSAYRRPMYWRRAFSAPEMMTAAPAATMCAVHNNRLWLVSRDDPSTVHYSAPYDPLAWDAASGAGYIVVGPNDGGDISALVPGFAGDLIIFKDSASGGSTYRLQGYSDADFVLSQVSGTIGAVSHRVATVVGDRDVFFASRRGLHSLGRVQQYGDFESVDIDSEVSTKWRSVPLSAKKRAWAVDEYERDTWIISYDTDGDRDNDEALLFNYRHQGARGNARVSTWDVGFNAAVMAPSASTGKGVLYTGDTATININGLEAGLDGSSDVDWEMELAPIDAGDIISNKAWEEVWFTIDNWGAGEMTMTWHGDDRPPSTRQVSMNPANAVTPFHGMPLNSVRGAGTGRVVRVKELLREGGVALTVGLSGDRGRVKIRGMRCRYRVLGEDANIDRFMPYQYAGD